MWSIPLISLTVLLGLILLFVVPCDAAITRIGSATAQCGTTNPCTVTYTPTAGNFLVVHAQSSSLAASSVSDNGAGSSYSSAFVNGGSSSWYTASVGTSVTAISVNYSGSNDSVAIVVEYSGVSPSSPLDQTNATVATGSGTTATATAVTTTQANELLIGWFANFIPSNFTASGSGWGNTVNVTLSSTVLAATDKIVSATGTYDATATLGSGTWYANISTYKASTAVSRNRLWAQ